VFKDATLYFSHATPNLAGVIPAMDRIKEKLESDALNRQFVYPVKAAITMGTKLLDHYYTLTEDSELYRIAMSAPSRCLYPFWN
jgi:hypothetical protein